MSDNIMRWVPGWEKDQAVRGGQPGALNLQLESLGRMHGEREGIPGRGSREHAIFTELDVYILAVFSWIPSRKFPLSWTGAAGRGSEQMLKGLSGACPLCTLPGAETRHERRGLCQELLRRPGSSRVLKTRLWLCAGAVSWAVRPVWGTTIANWEVELSVAGVRSSLGFTLVPS